jgi:hypothetical protein
VTRRRLAVALGVVAITAGGAIVARIVFDRVVYEPEPSATRSGEEPAPAGTVQVVAVRGTVERSSRAGAWGPIATGDQLGAEDSIRTGPSSTAELGVGERSRMTVADATQITVHEVTSAVHRFRLTRGRIAVDYGEGRGRRLRVEDESGRAVETEHARFGVLATGAMLAVATETGSVALRARGAEVAVGTGEQSAATGDGPPSPAEPIPSALLLKLASAAAGLDRDECTALSGAASTASSLDVDGEPVPIAEDGRFAVRVRRRRGQATVLVSVVDALGRTTQRVMPCREAEPRVKDLSVRWKR